MAICCYCCFDYLLPTRTFLFLSSLDPLMKMRELGCHPQTWCLPFRGSIYDDVSFGHLGLWWNSLGVELGAEPSCQGVKGWDLMGCHELSCGHWMVIDHQGCLDQLIRCQPLKSNKKCVKNRCQKLFGINYSAWNPFKITWINACRTTPTPSFEYYLVLNYIYAIFDGPQRVEKPCL